MFSTRVYICGTFDEHKWGTRSATTKNIKLMHTPITHTNIKVQIGRTGHLNEVASEQTFIVGDHRKELHVIEW